MKRALAIFIYLSVVASYWVQIICLMNHRWEKFAVDLSHILAAISFVTMLGWGIISMLIPHEAR